MYLSYAVNNITGQTFYFESKSIKDTFGFVRRHLASCDVTTICKDYSIINWSF